MEIAEAFSDLMNNTCLPNGKVKISLSASSRNVMLISEFQTKTWHLTFFVTVIAIAATYFTIAELKQVAQSLEQRELVGQRENHAKKMSLISNCLICIWNMCYSITFFVTAMYFKVRRQHTESSMYSQCSYTSVSQHSGSSSCPSCS